ncbi:MAG: 23S rRNA (uracil(1939)-C(5))-methyltransferase RlmD [Clostridia bacterium]|nr:23S rRNA (uracil(1939)-C(5))-methyltransferase RlmD [Clostridia bacterium]
MTDRKPRPRPVQHKPAENGSKTPCPYAARCGGCSRVHIPYGEQLKMKQSAVEKLLAGVCKVEPILGMADPWHYRSKVHAVIGTDFRTKQPIAGVYQRGTHRVVPVQGCLIEDPRADRIIRTIVEMIPKWKLRIYNENTHRGFLRHVMVRTGQKTDQIMVILVATASEFPGGKAFVQELTGKHPEITTVVLNVNQKETSMVLGTRDIPLFGPGYMEDELCGKRFRISPQSFYQVNARQTEVLYRTAIDFANLTGAETLLDAYCGTGTIGLCASDRVKQLIGVELNADAVRDAKVNARLNQVANADFICEDAGRFMVKMARENLPLDVLIMDPPRSGSDERFLRSVLTCRPKTIVYVSCNPETLARDARFLVKGGYKAVKAVPVDMFPHTEHCECVMLFQLS